VIRSFADKETERIAQRFHSRRFAAIERNAFRKLRQIENVSRIEELAEPPGNRLESFTEIAKGRGVFASTINGESVLSGEIAMPTKSKSLTTTKATARKTPPLHPGEMLREEFMKPLGLSANALALALRVPVTRISEIVHERRSVSADTALRLARYFRMSPEFWMRLQAQYDLESTQDSLAATIEREVRPVSQSRKNVPASRAIA
jgi:antitoxin HigA-1